MSVLFNGRLWTSPATMSAVDDSRMYGRGVSVGNTLAIIGEAKGGTPKTALRFGSASQARATLLDGELLRAVERAFTASSESAGPSTVIAVRVNPATQASLTLLDASAGNSIGLVATNYGAAGNQVKVKVEAGTNSGSLKLTTQYGTTYVSQDNVERLMFSIQYAGTGAGTMTVGNATLSLVLNAVTTNIALSDYPTVQSLVDKLGSISGITATVLDGNGEKSTVNTMDTATTVDIKTTAYTAKANLQAAVDWFNSVAEPYVTATRSAGATKVPATLAFTYLSGGSEGTTVTGDWTSAFTALEAEDVQWVVPVSSNAAYHASAAAHCAAMALLGKERRAIVGAATGTTDAQAIAAAKAINSDRVGLTHLGIYDYDAGGTLTLYPPYIAAAMIAGAFAGLNPGTPLTNKSLQIRGLERKLRNPTDTDELIKGGVLCIEETPTGYKVVQSISTWLTNSNYNRRELSVGVAVDYTMRAVREALDELRGRKANPITLNLAVERAETVLRELARPEPVGPGVLAGDTANPAYKNITAYIEGDILRVEFQASPVIPVNYIPIVCYAVPYSGTTGLSSAV